MNKIKLIALIFFLNLKLMAQVTTSEVEKLKFSLVFGLNQPIISRGFNIEINYYTKHFVFDYSHGFNLHFKNNMLTGDAKKQGLKFKIPHTLGFGIGYRLTKDFNIRIEPKMHIWNMYQAEKPYQDEHITKKYTTYTLGLGAYYRLMPFKNSQHFFKGITFVPSVRWWPNIATSLSKNKFQYFNTLLNTTEMHKANKIGIVNSPFFANVSLGYSF